MLDELELVLRQDHRRSASGLRARDLRHHVRGDRVKPGDRLIQDQQVRTMYECRRELNALLVAVRGISDLG
jgi:hypothetical protein